MNSPRRRRRYRRSVHWTESLYFWACVWIVLIWFALYEGLDFAKQLGIFHH